MTTTTDHTTPTTPEPPPWLNLDGYCPPEIRAQLRAATEGLAALLEPDSDFMRAVRAAYEAARDYEAATAPIYLDNAGTVLGLYTGMTHFEALTSRLESAAACACGDFARGSNPDDRPAWYVPWAERNGLTAEVGQ